MAGGFDADLSWLIVVSVDDSVVDTSVLVEISSVVVNVGLV